MNNDLQRDIMRPRAVIERLKAEGIGGLTEYSLYGLLKRGEIPARKPGGAISSVIPPCWIICTVWTVGTLHPHPWRALALSVT